MVGSVELRELLGMLEKSRLEHQRFKRQCNYRAPFANKGTRVLSQPKEQTAMTTAQSHTLKSALKKSNLDKVSERVPFDASQ